MAVGEIISVARYNAMQIKIKNVLAGIGTTGQFGYGQDPILSSPVSNSTTVNAVHMQQLNTDLIKAYVHQTGSDPGLPNVVTDNEITNAVYNSYETIVNSTYNNRNIIFESTQASVEAKLNSQRTSSWGGNLQPQTVTHEFSLTFNNANDRRYFFNAGSEIRFSASLTSSSGAKYNDWKNMLTALGTVKFNYDTTTGNSGTSPNGIGNFELTTTYQVIWIKSGSGVYSNNDLIAYAKTNTLGNVIMFKIAFNDGSIGGADEPVTGNLTSIITQLRATGVYVEVLTPVYQNITDLA